jgi:serine-type D-Ala-D-Ala carboxypeptidase/endopeptidase (penicillin-binding protein 4)
MRAVAAALLCAATWAVPLTAQTVVPLPPQPALPPDVSAALARAKVPADAMSIVVEEAGSARLRLQAQAQVPRNPASVTKLLTTYAALDLLGPAWAWGTPVWIDGPVKDGVLDGSLVIKGSGDPTLVVERLWLLLRRVQQAGVREIRGDIVLDRSAFAPATGTPADFDGEPLRPGNVLPDALLLNYKSFELRFSPIAGKAGARVSIEPPLAGVQVDATVATTAGACDDWRGRLKADFADPSRVRFAGTYPVACGELTWPVAYADPAGYNARLIDGLWRDMGGRLKGRVKDGSAPATPPSFEFDSPPLAEVVRSINKFSNNVMAQQLFLTLGLQQRGSGSSAAAREAMQAWMRDRFGEPQPDEIVLDNGSGLSRETRISARWLARLLQHAWTSPVMPELISSLPVNGLDGTARRSQATQGRAHLKTGSLRDVVAVAGFVLGDSGRRYVVVGLIQHPNAGAARPALDALVQWTMQDGAGR